MPKKLARREITSELFHKNEIVSEDSSWIFRFALYIIFVTPIFVALLIPVLTRYPLCFRLRTGRTRSSRRSTTAPPSAASPVAAVLCLAFGVLPTYVIPMLDSASMQLAGASASDALVPPFFASAQGHGTLPERFVGEFHDLGAQVGQAVLPGRGLVVLHRGGTENPVVFAMSTSGRSPPGALHSKAPVPAQLRKKPCNMRLSAVALARRAAV